MEGIEKIGAQIETLVRSAVEKQKPATVDVRGEPSHVTWLYNFSTGKVDRYQAEPSPRRYQAGGLRAVGQLVNEFAGRNVGDKPRTIVVFVQDGSVQAVLDEQGDRRERVVVGFQRSPSFKELVKLADPEQDGMSQRDFIALLRTDLAGNYSPDNLIPTIRKIKFSSTSEGNSSISTGKQSMGKQVEAEIAGLDGTAMDTLETVMVTVPIYSDLLSEDGKPVAGTFECHLDIDLAEQTFRLRPKAGEIERVLLMTDTWIMDGISFDTIPAGTLDPAKGRVLVVRGIPN